jgi:hypothetical protein
VKGFIQKEIGLTIGDDPEVAKIAAPFRTDPALIGTIDALNLATALSVARSQSKAGRLSIELFKQIRSNLETTLGPGVLDLARLVETRNQLQIRRNTVGRMLEEQGTLAKTLNKAITESARQLFSGEATMPRPAAPPPAGMSEDALDVERKFREGKF